MTPALQQLGALLRLRWRMLRTPGTKATTVAVGIGLAWLLVSVAATDDALGPEALATVLEVAPGAFLGFGVLAVIAPLMAGGGHQVFPPDELVAYPVRPSTHFLGGLVLAPVNLVWAVQLFALVGVTSVLTAEGDFALGIVTTVVFVAALTAFGQAVAWLVAGAHQSRNGRLAVRSLVVVLVVAAIGLVRTGNLGAAADLSPTRLVVPAVIAGGGRNLDAWWPTTAVLVTLTVAALLVGARCCAWALRRPSDARALRHTADRRRRDFHAGPLRALVAVDRASVWRAPALRRGGLVLLLLPGLVSALLRVPWESLIVLPGLVAAGAGLLFGVNAFALDGSGAMWLASTPVPPRLLLLSKAIVTGETVLASVIVAALATALRTAGPPTSSEVAAVVGSAFSCAVVVVALCLRSSLRRPHRAELNGPRDAVAPPGALAAASVRLAVPCAVIGMVLAAFAQMGSPVLPLALAVPIALTAVLSIIRSARRWDDPVERARVVHAVASG